MKKIALVLAGTLAAYVFGGLLLHALFPLPALDDSLVPKPGAVLENRDQGNRTRILSIENGVALGEMTVLPHAKGPPLLADVPRRTQRALFTLLAPTARLLGYRHY